MKSYIGAQTEINAFLKPLYLTFVATLKCNLRCPFCYAWRTKTQDELSLQEIEETFSSQALKNLVSVGITGGEPFLRKDIVEIASTIAENNRNLVNIRITTNGFHTEKIVSNIHEILDVTGLPIAVKISIDGVKATHDRIRCSGSFSKAMSTLTYLKRLKEKGYDLSISIGFTAVDENVNDIWKLYDEFGKDFEFFFKPAQTLPISPKGCPPLPISQKTRRSLIAFTCSYLQNEFRGKRTLWNSSRKLYYRYLLDFLGHPSIRPVPCSAAYSHFKLDSNGDVYACSVSPLRLGNVREAPLDKIWFSPSSFRIRRMITGGGCTCCTSCDLGPSILTFKWHEIILNYILGLFGYSVENTICSESTLWKS
ncbi:MAG: radical SAM protein [Candidatus Bathyarchaeota archaeon]|nr:MAG: radical SAM protein [Candidatus Bathyarchaeota archaeon]